MADKTEPVDDNITSGDKKILDMLESLEAGVGPDRTSVEQDSATCKPSLEMGAQVADLRLDSEETKVVYYLRDISTKMVDSWTKIFKDHTDRIKVSKGDIFINAPAVDAIVSPANSFGFMDGGIDQVYTDLFGWQMQTRLQKVIREEYDGENIVGNAIIIPAYDKEPTTELLEGFKQHNITGGQPIKYLISAPTMRVPKDVMETNNAFLAFRATILSVQKHNRNHKNDPIRSVLCPGLGTAVGRMPFDRCAFQMLQAYEMHDLRTKDHLIHPANLWVVTYHDSDMEQYKDKD